MSLSQRAYIAAFQAMPRRLVTRAGGALTRRRSQMAVRRFAAAYQIDMDEAEHPLEAYDSVQSLFVRRLKPGVRPVNTEAGVMVSPVDGRLALSTPIRDGRLAQAKGRFYTVGALLGEEADAARFEGGHMINVYLSPRDYHRIHSPVDGEVSRWRHVPGDLFPVNAAAATYVDAIYARNERLIAFIETEAFGPVAVVMVGATVVGKVRASFVDGVSSNAPGVVEVREGAMSPPVAMARGDELGVFDLGSTVIILTARSLSVPTEPGGAVRMGEALGARL